MGRLLDTAGAAEYLGESESKVRGWVERRQIPFMKVGRSLRFDVRQLDRWIEQGHRAAS